MKYYNKDGSITVYEAINKTESISNNMLKVSDDPQDDEIRSTLVYGGTDSAWEHTIQVYMFIGSYL